MKIHERIEAQTEGGEPGRCEVEDRNKKDKYKK
jgi:hypothetical protein